MVYFIILSLLGGLSFIVLINEELERGVLGRLQISRNKVTLLESGVEV